MKNLDILNGDLVATLTDFKGNQNVFQKAFAYNQEIGTPIKTVIELGVYRIDGEPNSPLPGQSTKTLMVLGDAYEVEKFISLDIDNCQSTIDFCRNWVESRGFKVNNLFVQSSSLNFKVEDHLPNGIDLIFLDTNHDDLYPDKIGYIGAGGAGMTFREICHYAKHLTVNGRFFLHDTKNYYVEKRYGFNTEGAIAKFLDENPDFGFKEHNTNSNGLGELYKKNSKIGRLYND